MSAFSSAGFLRLWTSTFSLKLKPQLRELYASSLIFSFAYALVTIFEPIFFYQIGFSFSSIALYYAFHYVLYTFSLPLGGMFASRFGVERSISLSLPIFVTYFLVLAATARFHELIILAALLLTTHKTFYWPAFHANFAAFGDEKNRGTELSWMSLLKYGVGIAGPLAGGFIASIWGFPILFTIAAGLVLVSIIPLLRTADEVKLEKLSYSDPWKLVGLRKHRHAMVSMVGWGENLVDLVFWPLFLFIIIGTTKVLGIVVAGSAAIMTVTGFIIGEIADRYPRRLIIRLHLPFMVAGYFLRPLIGTPVAAFFTDSLARLAYVGMYLPTLFRLYVLAGESKQRVNYMVAVELVLAITKALVAFGAAAVFAIFLPYTAFWIVFVSAAILAIFYGVL